MKTTAVFALLLLVCRVSSDPQADVLEGMNVLLAKQDLDLMFLKNHVTDLENRTQEQAAKLGDQQTAIDELKKQQTEQAAKLEKLEDQQTDIDELRRRLTVKQVAFSASLVTEGRETFGPFDGKTTLILNRVATNIGSAYNPETGIFTAPVAGAYNFQWYIGGYGGDSGTGAVLVKNSEHTYVAYEHHRSVYASSANGIVLLLEAGDVVFLRPWVNTSITDDENQHTTFSGHLLFPM